MDEQFEFLKEIAARLHAARIPYMLTGSVALSVYAKPRMTRDVDVVVELQLKDVDPIVKLFEKDCYVNRDAVQRAVGEQSMFSIIHQEWIIKADFIVRKEEPYRRAEFERRRERDVGGVSMSVVTPEDLLLSKLCWIKESGSEVQQCDVKELVRSVEDLDWRYVEKWADELGVREWLQKVRPS